MTEDSLRVKFANGDIIIEIAGKPDKVISELSKLKKDGIGRINEFFGGFTPSMEGTPGKDSKTPPLGRSVSTSAAAPSLNDIVMKNLPSTEPEWIVIYAFFASNNRKEIFGREKLIELYKSSKRWKDTRISNLNNSISSAVNRDWLSNLSGNDYLLTDAGQAMFFEIISREKVTQKPARRHKSGRPKKEVKSQSKPRTRKR